MKAKVYMSDMRIVEREITDEQAEALSKLADVAAVYDTRESFNGSHVIYQDGVRRQYNPVTNEIIGAAQPFHYRNGHMS